MFVANRSIPAPESDAVQMAVVADTDEWIAAEARRGDLAVTRDLPLAARLVASGVEVVTDRGEHYTQENMAARLSERDATMQLREAGLLPNRGASRRHGARETQAFAALLDRELTARSRSSRD